MDDTGLRGAVAALFDQFVEAFRTFDGNEIARRYLSPYSALHADGSIDCFATNADIAKYSQKVIDGCHDKGCRSCRYKDLEVVSVGRRCALGTVTWELVRVDGSLLSSWRESYNLARIEDGLRVFASVDHVKRSASYVQAQSLVRRWFHGYISKFALNFCAARRIGPKADLNQ